MKWLQVQRARSLKRRLFAAWFMALTNAVAWAIGGPIAFTVATAINLSVWILALSTTRAELDKIEGRCDDSPRLN